MTRTYQWGMALATGLVACAVQASVVIEHWTEPSGARVALIRLTNLPMVDLQVDVDAGSRRDPEALTGLASATTLMLTQSVRAHNGQAALDENAVAEAWADLGAQFGVSATSDRMSVRLRTLSQGDVAQSAIDLAAKQLAYPAFDAPLWDRDRQRLIAAWQDRQQQPDVIASRSFQQAVFRGHPYGREAEPEHWQRMTVTDMANFYREHALACNARVSVVGDVTREQASAWVQQLLAAWAPHGCPVLPAVAEVEPLAEAQAIRLPAQASQAHIWVGQPGIARADPDFFPIVVGNHILGGSGFTSRLMQEIREKRGLTYGVFSFFSPGKHAGTFGANMQTRPDQAQQALDLIQAEIRQFVERGPTAKELADAQQSLVQGFVLRIDTNRKLLDNLAAMLWNDLPMDYLDNWTQQIQAVTREQIQAAFARVLQPERMVTVVVGGQP